MKCAEAVPHTRKRVADAGARECRCGFPFLSWSCDNDACLLPSVRVMNDPTEGCSRVDSACDVSRGHLPVPMPTVFRDVWLSTSELNSPRPSSPPVPLREERKNSIRNVPGPVEKCQIKRPVSLNLRSYHRLTQRDPDYPGDAHRGLPHLSRV